MISKTELLDALLWVRGIRARAPAVERHKKTIAEILQAAITGVTPIGDPWRDGVLAVLETVESATAREIYEKANLRTSFRGHQQMLSRAAQKGLIERVPGSSPIAWRRKP